MKNASRLLYVALYKNGDELTGHGYSLNPASLTDLPKKNEEASSESEDPSLAILSDLTFASVLRVFISAMDSYRKFIPLMLDLAPVMSSVIGERRVGKFVRDKGIPRPDLSTNELEVYELNMNMYREFMVHHDEVVAALEGARHLPEVMTIGLVSSYDAFLGQLLRATIRKHEEIIFTSDRTIKFSELSQFSSIEEARDALIDREIESVLRLSHHEQFEWMEKRFSLKLKESLPAWPRFVEICERRNLLTHTGGVVSKQYLNVCKDHGCDLENIKIGDMLSVNSDYYVNAVKVMYEIGVKLGHVFWRKFVKEDREEADSALNKLGYDLIYDRAYEIAEALLRFGVQVLKQHANDSVRRMMVINLANSLRLQNRRENATQLLKKEDWSACSADFKICVAAVTGEIDEVARLMRSIGAHGHPTIEAYRTWPVFRGVRTDERFMTTFEEVFGESIISEKPGGVGIPSSANTKPAVADEGGDPTLH
jgi:hypothetical protein